MPVAMKMAATFGRSDDAGGTPALPVLIPACAGKTKRGRVLAIFTRSLNTYPPRYPVTV